MAAHAVSYKPPKKRPQQGLNRTPQPGLRENPPQEANGLAYTKVHRLLIMLQLHSLRPKVHR